MPTTTEREAAYLEKFGTKHPKDEVVLRWARQTLNKEGLRFHRGLFKCSIKEGNKTITRHLRRVGLMSAQGDVLGVGTDAVEAVAQADIQHKRSLAARAAENQNQQKDKNHT